MARRCIDINLNGTLMSGLKITDFTILGTQKDSSGSRVYSASTMPSFVSSVGSVYFADHTAVRYVADNGSVYERSVVGSYNGTTGTLQAEGYPGYGITFNYTVYSANTWIGFVVDDDTQEGWIIALTHYNNNTYLFDYFYSNTQNQPMYNYIGEEGRLYNWTSVPTISGKNGILSLSILNDINDGNPVTTSDINKFYLEKASNLSTLINNAINL